jgi:mannose PTS system EIIA component
VGEQQRGEGRSVIGVLIVTHYRLAHEFLQALRLIIGEAEHFAAIGLDPGMSPEEMRAQIQKALHDVDQGHGVLVLVDMFGGTPSNLCLSFLEEGRIEVVTGLNLPMLVKVGRIVDQKPLHEVAATARDYGRRNISVASDLLAGREKPGGGGE